MEIDDLSIEDDDMRFLARFLNLQELTLNFRFKPAYKDFVELQHVTFSQLQVLRFKNVCPKPEYLNKFLENNGKDLRELHLRN